jgi:hypothetical protein
MCADMVMGQLLFQNMSGMHVFDGDRVLFMYRVCCLAVLPVTHSVCWYCHAGRAR